MALLSIEQTPVWSDIKDVMYGTAKPTRFEYRALLHTEKEDLPVFKIDVIDIVRDYVNNIGELVQVEFKMPLGEYITRLYPFRSNLEFTIKRILLTDSATTKLEDSRILTTRFKAVFLADENPNYTGTDVERMDIDSLNNMDVVQVRMQLLNRSLEVIRVRQTQGIFRQVKMKQLIHNLVAGESLKVQIDGKPAIDAINIVEPDNSETRRQVIIPSATGVTSIPSLLQEKMGGVYNSGIGNFLQSYAKKLTWFIYPTTNTKRFDSAKDDKVIFYALPEGRFQALDRTYQKDASILKVLVTGQRKYKDAADVDYMNQGSGFRMADARAFMKRSVEITPDGPKALRSNLNTEVVAEERKDGLNYARIVTPSSNPFKEFSKVNARNVARVDIVWENSDPELIYPGMPCKYIYLDENKTVELAGTVVFAHTTVQRQGLGLQSSTFMTNTALTLLCQQKPVTRSTNKQTAIGGVF